MVSSCNLNQFDTTA